MDSRALTFGLKMAHDDITLSPGVVLQIFGEEEAAHVIQDWLGVFARKRSGCRIKDYKWHLFSGGFYEAEEGSNAEAVYRSHVAENYLVIDNDESVVFLTDQRPEKVDLSDYYVCVRGIWLGRWHSRMKMDGWGHTLLDTLSMNNWSRRIWPT